MRDITGVPLTPETVAEIAASAGITSEQAKTIIDIFMGIITLKILAEDVERQHNHLKVLFAAMKEAIDASD